MAQEGSRRAIGDKGEGLAVAYLVNNGYRIVQRNFCIRGGEIDIIATKNRQLCFIEVKTRSNDRFGTPAESITWNKRAHLHRAINHFLLQANFEDLQTTGWQIDILEVYLTTAGELEKITHTENYGYE